MRVAGRLMQADAGGGEVDAGMRVAGRLLLLQHDYYVH
jgi:hypothetical protein